LRDIRIISLKILAVALMSRIESLDSGFGAHQADQLNLQCEVNRFEAELIRKALIETSGRQRPAAKLLGVKVSTLHTKIKRHGIRLNDPAVVEDSSAEQPQDKSDVSTCQELPALKASAIPHKSGEGFQSKQKSK
jgi:hypothetical protein